MGKRKADEQPTTQMPDWHLGDEVLWSGIKMKVVSIREDGLIEVMNRTLRVHVDSAYDLERVPNGG